MALVKLNNRGVRSATTFGSISGLGEMRFIKKLTASSDSELSFVDGTDDVVLDDTYKEYLFTFKDIHPSASSKLSVNFSIDAGSNYNVTKTNTLFNVQHDEADSYGEMAYSANDDLAQSTAFAVLSPGSTGTDNDSNLGGFLRLFNPSSSVFVKHFIAEVNHSAGAASNNCFMAGYCNTTSDVDAVQFKMSTGDIDAGDICLYGIN
jgi:hypothetical protein